MTKKSIAMKLLLFLLLLLFYTYAVIFYTANETLKIFSIGNIQDYGIMQMVIDQNKSAENFINSQISSSIAMSETNYSIFTSPVEFYYFFTEFKNKRRLCETVLKDSKNLDIKNFLEKHCKKESL